MKLRLKIKTQQQPDATWKAWVGDGWLVVYAETKVKATDIVKMILEDKGNYIPAVRPNARNQDGRGLLVG